MRSRWSILIGREPGAPALKQRFGPIAGKQGHRRLNVLFSRARMRIALFTSFGSADVRPGELSADGPRVLKRYLENAETRGRAVVESIANEPDSDFEIEVGERLRAKGYELDFQVGVSGYKIDLAVRHPDHAERFLAGIECDGARYHSSKSARDRDRLREEVLDGLGWAILRVWSTDWFDNPELETDKLVAKLEDLRSGPPHTFLDYQMMDAFDKGELDPVEPHSVNGADGATAAAERLNLVPPSPGVQPNDEPVLEDDRPLTRGEAYKVLEDFRESVIKPAMENWEPHRSILRDGMIETFIMQRLNEPGDWFNKVPQFQRTGTNPLEKTRFLARICEIVERIDDGAPRAEPFALTPPIAPAGPGQAPLPLAPVIRAAAPSADGSRPEPQYIIADIANLSLTPRPDRFYEKDYKATIGRIADYIIEVEAPVFGDVVVTRIARMHGYLRTGNTIQKLVISAVDGRFPKTTEDGREVFWPVGVPPGSLVPFRASSDQERSHNDVPIAELSGLALPYIRIRMDDEQVLRKMAEYFGLGRLREATRARFYQAVMLAKSVQA